MRKLILLMLTVLAGHLVGRVQAQDFVLAMPDTTVAPNEVVSVPIRTREFREIVSMQFSLHWDPSVIDFESTAVGDLENVAIGDVKAADGELRLSWFDIDGTGRSYRDESVVIYLNFRAIAAEGNSSPVTFSGSPLPIQIYRAGSTPGEHVEVNFLPEDGLVTIAEAISVSVAEQITGISCNGADDGQINISVLANTEVTINWEGPDFTSNEAFISDLKPGEYTLRINDKSGNVLYESNYLMSQPEELEIFNIHTADADCDGQNGSVSIQFAGGTGPFTYDLGNGPADLGELEDLAPADYTLLITDVNGCSATSTFTIEAPARPVVDLGPALQICPGESTTLTAGEFANYAWSTGASTASIVVSEPAVYGLTVTNAEGCRDADEVLVSSGADVQLLIENDFLDVCPGDSIDLLVSGAETYSWTDPSGSLSALNVPNPRAAPDTTTMYRVVGSNTCGADTVDLEVFVHDVFAMAGPDTCVGPGNEAQLMAFGGVSYFWESARYPVSNPNIADPVASPEDSTTYYVRITDSQGCMTRDSMIVLVGNAPESTIVAVNLITPNGDERNDVLYFNNIEKYGQNSLKIFNRWGNLIYQKVNYMSDEDRFDGTYKGKPLPPGTYYYILSFRTGEIKQKITILR